MFGKFLLHNGGIPYLQITASLILGALLALLYAKFCKPAFLYGKPRTVAPSITEMTNMINSAQKEAQKSGIKPKTVDPPKLPDYPMETFKPSKEPTGSGPAPFLVDTNASDGGRSDDEFHQYEPFEPSDAMSDDGEDDTHPNQFNNNMSYAFMAGVQPPKEMMTMNGMSKIQEMSE